MKNRSGFFVRVLSVAAIMLAFVMIINVQMQLTELKKVKAELEKEVLDYADRVDELQYEIDRPIDDDYITEIARKSLGYYKLGDTVFYYDFKN